MMKFNIKEKTVFLSVILLSVCSILLIATFSSDPGFANSAASSGSENWTLPDIQFVKQSIDRLLDIFRQF
jgi:hypothetical protein